MGSLLVYSTSLPWTPVSSAFNMYRQQWEVDVENYLPWRCTISHKDHNDHGHRSLYSKSGHTNRADVDAILYQQQILLNITSEIGLYCLIMVQLSICTVSKGLGENYTCRKYV